MAQRGGRTVRTDPREPSTHMDIQKKYSTPDGLALAVVHSGGTRFIGKLTVGAKPGDSVVMTECCELRASVAVLPTPQGIAVSPQSIPCLLDGAEDFVDVPLVVHVLRYFDDMDVVEAEKYIAAREAKAADIQRARAAKAGITLARELPKGGGFDGGFKPPSS